jgi:hypothetical protein
MRRTGSRHRIPYLDFSITRVCIHVDMVKDAHTRSIDVRLTRCCGVQREWRGSSNPPRVGRVEAMKASYRGQILNRLKTARGTSAPLSAWSTTRSTAQT